RKILHTPVILKIDRSRGACKQIRRCTPLNQAAAMLKVSALTVPEPQRYLSHRQIEIPCFIDKICPFLSILSLSNNQLGHGSQSFPDGVLSPLFNLRTLNLSHNQLTSVPMGLPPSIIELYLKGNLIKQLHERTFIGMTKLEVLDFSGNKLTNDGLGNSLNVTHLESLNLEANQLEQVPQTLPSSLKVLNLGSNLISSIKKVAFSNLKKLELLSVARNKVFEVAAGAFRALSFLHQLDFSHNTLQKVPRLLPRNVHSVSLSNNRIRSVPADAFCWGNQTLTIGRRVHVELENNLIDSGTLDPKHRAGDSTFNLGNFARRQENYELN
uniref:Uncharacterized protein n=1 Tax=Gouania willdenowi TaxID=441366 RepID=A0A8C5GZF1_GOUWI